MKQKSKAVRLNEYARDPPPKLPPPPPQSWSPVVSKGVLLKLQEFEGLELIVNQSSTARVTKLRAAAMAMAIDESNGAFRMLQILERLK